MMRHVNIITTLGSDAFGVPSVSIYFSHCDKPIKCKGCHNKELQEDKRGYNLSFEEIVWIIDCKLDKLKRFYSDIAIVYVGGEPTSPLNIDMVMKISKYYYGKNKNIMYTWREKEMLKDKWIENMNMVICGEYDENKKDESYVLGSTNQYIINNKKEIIQKFN